MRVTTLITFNYKECVSRVSQKSIRQIFRYFPKFHKYHPHDGTADGGLHEMNRIHPLRTRNFGANYFMLWCFALTAII